MLETIKFNSRAGKNLDVDSSSVDNDVYCDQVVKAQ